MGIKAVIERVKGLERLHVKAGVMGGATYDNGQSVAEVAIRNEYGAAGIPKRPFLRNTVARDRSKWLEGAGKLGGAYLEGRIELEAVGKKLGAAMQAGILETIDSNMPPPNAPSTVRSKLSRLKSKRGKPIAGGAGTIRTLVDSDVMRESVSFEVET